MARELSFSIGLHLLIVATTLLASPFEIEPRQFEEVIRVSAIAMSDIRPNEPEPIPEAATPMALEAEPEEIALDDPTTKPAAKIEPAPEKPKPKPKSKPKPKTPAQQGDKNQTGAEDGQKEVEAPSGSSISGVRIDNAAFDHPYWFDLAYGRINQTFRVPISIDGRVFCDIYFQVIKSGRVIENKVVSPSGIPAFDAACLAAIDRASPFPPLPRDFLDEIIGITITFTN